MIQIPVFQSISADFSIEIELEDQLVKIDIIYNIRNERFHIYIEDGNGNIINGIKAVPNWPLLDRHKGFTDLTGDFLILKTDESAENDITYDNFGNGWDLFYLDENELEQWKDENGF